MPLNQTVNPLLKAQLASLMAAPKLTPATLMAHLDPTWIPGEWLMFVSLKIAQAIRKGNGRLIISVPPRHGKSRIGSIGSSIWTLENWPDKEVIVAAYGADLATEFSGPVKDFILDNQDKLAVRLRSDSQRVNRFKTPQGGGVVAAGLGGAITGRGADVLFIDDYIKEIKDAESQTQRDYHWKWFVTTAMTRLEPNATVIIIATRWHRDDLIGRILLNHPEDWDYIRLPALAEKNDLIGREVGEPLFPERYDLQRLVELRQLLGSHYFNAVFQQNPENDETNVTNPDWLQYITPGQLPNIMHLQFARIWDLAGTAEAGDYTAWGLCAVDTRMKSFFMLDLGHKQMSPQKIEDLLRKKAEEDGKGIPVLIEQEPGSAGINLIHHIKAHVLQGHQVIGVPTTSKKLVRATPFLAGCEASRVFLLKAPSNHDFVEEFRLFPDVDHDDLVDVAAIGWQYLIGDEIGPTWGRLTEDRSSLSPEKREGEGSILTGAVWGRAKRKSGSPLGQGSTTIFRPN